jgi:hypothetical protein
MDAKQSDDQYTPEETARRRDAVVKAMINTPPTPRKPLGKKAKRPTHRARVSPPKRST